MKTYYQAAVKTQNSWNPDGSMILKSDCGHNHSTITGAGRCLDKLSQTWADGTHNEWAHFGMIIAVDENGVRSLTEDEQKIRNNAEYQKMQAR